MENNCPAEFPFSLQTRNMCLFKQDSCWDRKTEIDMHKIIAYDKTNTVLKIWATSEVVMQAHVTKGWSDKL